jgi:hypothetical protein
MGGVKHCYKCAQDLPLDAFGNDRGRPDGKYPFCRRCRKAQDAVALAAAPYKPVTVLLKTCTKCGKEKPADAFKRRKHSADGLRNDCAACNAARTRVWAAEKRPRTEKRCPACEETKSATSFSSDAAAKDGLHWRCNGCANDTRRAKTAEKIAGWSKSCVRCAVALKPSYGIWSQRYCPACRPVGYAEVRTAAVKAWTAKQDPSIRRAKSRAHGRKRRQDPKYRVHDTMTSRIHKVLRRAKGLPLHKILPYSHQQLVDHLEAQFQPGMSWENYGRKGWHVGHRKPVCRFKFTAVTDKGFQECWALANLFPQWEEENLKAGARREFPAAEHVTATLAPRS